MKTLHTALAAITLAACTAACDDFLTELPEHEYTVETSVYDYNSAKNIVNGIYGVYVSQSNLGGQIYGHLHCMAGIWDYTSDMYNMSYTQTSNNYQVPSIWQGLYATVNAANAAIEGVSALPEGKFPSLQEKERLLAEARCFRAYSNLQLLWYFGHWFDGDDSPYGLLYRDRLSDLANLMVGRITVGQSYAAIIDDLKYAEEHLGDFSTPRKLSRQFAQAVHAKLLVNRNRPGDYAEALALVNDILATAPAKFKMEADLGTVYSKGWDSNEVLFSRYLGDKSSFTSYEFNYSYALYYTNEFAPAVQEWLDADPRYATVWGTARSPESWDASTKDKVLVKMYHGGRVSGPNDMYATYNFRYEELYLMKAELLARTVPSDLAAPVAVLNDMRAARTAPALPALETPATHELLMDMIYREYVCALIMENETPWFASVRFEHGGQPWVNVLKPDVNFSTNQYCWPIPDAEIIAHTNRIEQNEGLK